ncbi:ATP-binding cassette sub-family A member 3-like [Trichosurus vulpecula]|uniref:ATP-binding cassette sub-family A member 3-like n=1 Tax=Trichosurus vulpecula TaxID=9337 RepID=UPI00186B51AF|nr:ATP-binding cassette sub-family A member 3-like [Trichosurus vulpecula]
MGRFHKFTILLWKNFIMMKRVWYPIVMELALSLVCTSFILILRSVSYEVSFNSYNYPVLHINKLPTYFESSRMNNTLELVYVPSTSDAVKTVIDNMQKTLGTAMRVRGFLSEFDFEDYIKIDSKSSKVLAAIVFHHNFGDIEDSLPLQVSYSLRFSPAQRNSFEMMPSEDKEGWLTDNLFPPISQRRPRNYLSKDGGQPGYFVEGFLAVQHAVDKAIIQYHRRNTVKDKSNITPLVFVKRFPLPSMIIDDFYNILHLIFPFSILLVFSTTVINAVHSVVSEKQNNSKEYLRIMGLSNFLLWSSYFFVFFMHFLLIVLFLIVLLFAKIVHLPVIRYSDMSLVFVFLMCFAIVSIIFSFMLSTFFSKTKMISSVGFLVYFISYLPHIFVQSKYKQLALSQKLLSCLFSNVAMNLGIKLLIKSEIKGTGLHWEGLRQPVTTDDDLCFEYILEMLLFDSFIYAMVTWYMEAVFPGQYGIPQPWNFFLKPSHWFGTSKCITAVEDNFKEDLKNEYIENEPIGLVPGIQIRHLCKVFTKGYTTKTAVKDLTLNFFEGQVSVLLGHNGAGKTTILSMLTGMFPPTSGEAYIYGYAVSKNIVQIRKSLGFCPQYDILFDYMTVSEHLYFYAQLKGLTKQECHKEIVDILNTLNLGEKHNTLSKSLSRGTKRKLSICIALIGNSKVVILDEPTSGMDPISRRVTWNLIQQCKRGCTILLTTHYMDEADLLGDRIAIMANGTLQCCGSSLFLKQKYGAGYHMIIVKNSNCKVEKISHIVHQFVPSATLESNSEAELSFMLPKESTKRFEALFTELEREEKELGIASYGISVTTMEEVFLRVGELVDLKMDLQDFQKLSSLSDQQAENKEEIVHGGGKESNYLFNTLPMHDLSSMTFNTGCTLYCQQFYAMFVKKAVYSWRHWKMTLIYILVPLLYVSLLLGIFRSPVLKDDPALNLVLSSYGKTIVPFSISGNSSVTQEILKYIKAVLTDKGQILKEVKGNLEEFLGESRSCVEHCIVAFSIEVNKSTIVATALFNNQAYHSPATSLAVVDNILFMLFCGPKASLEVFNKPQPHRATDSPKESLGFSHGYEIAFILIFGIATLPSSFSQQPVTERVIGAKHIQFVSGVYVLSFWLSALIWDIISFFILYLLLLGLFRAHDLKYFFEDIYSLNVLLIFMLYGWSIIPLTYLMSFFFSRGPSAEFGLFLFNIFSGLVSMPIVFMIDNKVFDLGVYSEIVTNSFLLLPSYTFGMSVQGFFENFKAKKFCAISQSINCQGKCAETNFYSWNGDGIGKFLVAMAASGFFYLLLLCLIEIYVWKLRNHCTHFLFSGYLMWQHIRKDLGLSQKKEQRFEVPEISEDEDVANEKKKIREYPSERLLSLDRPLIIKNLLKVYFKWLPFLAVDRLCLEVQKMECFGLLGLNGAGKTTTFKMLTGDETITSGDAFVENYSVYKDLRKVRNRISYCPQVDALLDYMTSREMLTMYARLWGIPESYINQYVKEMLQLLLLDEYADKITMNYSCGTKKKLSTGIALLGNPSVIFLDEPSSGMDPVARRLFWNMIIQTRQSGKAIVITSHSMEECKALCTRMAIMVKGRFQCLGSLQHLKNKFSKGYTLLAKIKSDHQASVLEYFKKFIKETFPGSTLLFRNQRMVRFCIPIENLSWSKVFGILENAKEEFDLEDYSISQATLEQVFLHIANAEMIANE